MLLPAGGLAFADEPSPPDTETLEFVTGNQPDTSLAENPAEHYTENPTRNYTEYSAENPADLKFDEDKNTQGFSLLGNVQKIDKTALQTLFDEAGILNENNYTAGSWAEAGLPQALVGASVVLVNDEATPAEIEDAYNNLNAAVDKLVAIYGTTGNPYKIYSAADMFLIDKLDAHYILMNDVDMTQALEGETQRLWTPLGQSGSPFTGSFNGDGHRILNLKVSVVANAGLFGDINGAMITGLTLENCNITNANTGSTGYAGGIAATGINTTITNCNIVNGTIIGPTINTTSGVLSYVGGIVGQFTGGTIQNCVVSGTITNAATRGSYCGAGGIVGHVKPAKSVAVTISNCDVEAIINGVGYVGGIVGNFEPVAGAAGALTSLTISRCYFSGTVETTANAGGILGSTNNTSMNYSSLVIEYCIVDANISGVNNVGGIAGCSFNINGGTNSCVMTISYCSYRGNVTGSGNSVGGIAGKYAFGTISDCTVSGAVSGKSDVGGIAGAARVAVAAQSVAIQNCSVKAGITGSSNNVGGIAGSFGVDSSTSVVISKQPSISNCFYEGAVTSRSDTSGQSSSITGTGGIVGVMKGTSVENCVSSGSVISQDAETEEWKNNVGGIVGYVQDDGRNSPTIKNCYTTASVWGGAHVGGILGYSNCSSVNSILTINDCRALNKSVSGDDGSTGGIYGSLIKDGSNVISDTYAWKGLLLNESPLQDIRVGDPRYSSERSGIFFWSYSLKNVTGWPEDFTKVNGVWSYEAGKLPVLKTISGVMNDTFPAYMDAYLIDTIPGDKTSLNAAIDEAARTVVFELYPDGWTAYLTVLQASRNVANPLNTEATQEEIDTAKIALSDAIDVLKEKNKDFFRGVGTAADPYEIDSAYLLLKMNSLIFESEVFRNKSYKLTSDIEMDGEKWIPNLEKTSFTGTFDGDSHTISNLKVNTDSYAGLFGYADIGGTVKNLRLTNCDISSSSKDAGGIIGFGTGNSVTISNCYAQGKVAGIGGVGGILGNANTTTTLNVSGCYFNGLLTTSNITSGTTSTAANIGGIVGMTNTTTTGTIANCRSDGAIMLAKYAGGIIGNYGGSSAAGNMNLVNCFTTMRIGSAVTATDASKAGLGGLVGYNNSTATAAKLTVTDSLALNESVSGGKNTNVGEMHAFRTAVKFSVSGVGLAWDGMPLLKTGQTGQIEVSYPLAGVSYETLQVSGGWPAAFTDAGETNPWSFADGGLPVLKTMTDVMSVEFPKYMKPGGTPKTMADKVALLVQIQDAENLNVTVSFLVEALDAAKLVLFNIDATQIEVDDACSVLDRANKRVVGANLQGNGTDTDPFLIGTTDDLLAMAILLDNALSARSKYYKLTADIDMKDVAWISCGFAESSKNYKPFGGDFDGDGFTIFNLSRPLFTFVKNGKVHDLTLEDYNVVYEKNNANGSIAVEATNAVIENCSVSGNAKGAGIVGTISSGQIKNCHFVEGVITNQTGLTNVGGIVASATGIDAPITIEDCTVGTPQKQVSIVVVSSTTDAGVGGVVGITFGTISIINCHVFADIAVSTSSVASQNGGNNVGGIAGTLNTASVGSSSILVSGCSYEGIISTKGGNNGGIAGYVVTSKSQSQIIIEDCYSAGEIIFNGREQAVDVVPRPSGGIAGDALGIDGNITIKNSKTEMSINGFNTIGGLVGKGRGDLTLSGNHALNPSLSGTNVGAIIGIEDILLDRDNNNKTNITFDNNTTSANTIINDKARPPVPTDPDDSNSSVGNTTPPETPKIDSSNSTQTASPTTTDAPSSSIVAETASPVNPMAPIANLPGAAQLPQKSEVIDPIAVPTAPPTPTIYEALLMSAQNNPLLTIMISIVFVGIILMASVLRYRKNKNE